MLCHNATGGVVSTDGSLSTHQKDSNVKTAFFKSPEVSLVFKIVLSPQVQESTQETTLELKVSSEHIIGQKDHKRVCVWEEWCLKLSMEIDKMKKKTG